MHAVGIVHPADEAVVLLHFDEAGVVALGLWGHGDDSNLGSGKPGAGLESKASIAEGMEKGRGGTRRKMASLPRSFSL